MSNFDLSSLALASAFPTNKILTDDKGLPSVMVYIPKFKMSDVIDGAGDSTHPAFIVNGVEKDGIYISKYQNVAYNNSHGVQDTPLHGFQSVHDVGYGTFQDYVRGIIQEPVLIHAAQLVLDVCIIGIRRFIIRMPFAPLREFFIQIIFCSFKVFAHICSGVVYS